MPKYKFQALDLENKKVLGTIDAVDENEMRKALRRRELVVVKYGLVEEKYRRYRLKPREVAEFSHELSTMLSSGITAVRAVEIIMNRDIKPVLRSVYKRLYNSISQGNTISEAMLSQGSNFPELLINMYASGEASGQLDRVAAKMAVHYEKEHRLNTKVKSAMIYPIILLIATFAVVMVVFTLVLPKFFDLFEDIPLPLITKIVVGISSFLQKFWHIIIVGLAGIIIGSKVALAGVAELRLAVDKIKLHMPVAGKQLKIIYTARFSRTLSSLYSSGISLVRALEIGGTIVGNKYIENQFEDVIKNVRQGDPLSESVSKVRGFDSKLASIILIGEETGKLDSMLESGANGFDFEAEAATERLVKLLEPVMIVLMALIIGPVMLSVVLPIISIYENVGNI